MVNFVGIACVGWFLVNGLRITKVAT